MRLVVPARDSTGGGRGNAREERDAAEREGRVATARELAAAAVANLDVDPERSVLLALAAVDHTRSVDGSVLPEAEQALHWATTASRVERRVADVGGSLDWSPDRGTFVTEGREGSGMVDIRDARNGESMHSFRGHDGDVTAVAFKHHRTPVAPTREHGAARVWDPSPGEELHTVRSPGGTEALGP